MNVVEIRDFLKNKLTSYQVAAEFFGELGYTYANDAPVPTRDWPKSALELGVNPVYMAQHGDFKIIFVELSHNRMARSIQRPILDQLAMQHPFFMTVFHLPANNTWEFVNVRVISDIDTARMKRIARRMTISNSERQQNRLYTTSQRLSLIDISDQPTIGLNALHTLHERAFDVEQVTNEFYDQYVRIFVRFSADIAQRNSFADGSAEVAQHAQALLNRLMFLYFIQRKGWLNEEYDYLYSRFERLMESSDAMLKVRENSEANTYYANVIIPLFRALSNRDLQPDNAIVPFLNGGLFQFPQGDPFYSLHVSNSAFKHAFDELFEKYTFTVEEDMPDDRAVAIDPEMLGKVFERLVLRREQERDLRKGTGSYYTPREIVQFMCQHSLSQYLIGAWRDTYKPTSPDGELPFKLEGRGGQHEMRTLEIEDDERRYAEKITRFITLSDATALGESEARRARELLLKVRVIDPAVGSGAFLVGMLQEIIRLVSVLDTHTGDHAVSGVNYTYDLKRNIIGRSLYGVDLQAEAVQICELRLWLSLVVDFEPQRPNQPISVWINEIAPLPNLSYLVREGNSLIEQVLGETFQFNAPRLARAIDLTLPAITQVQDLKALYYRATDTGEKARLDRQILVQQAALTGQLLRVQANEATRLLEKQYPLALPGMEKSLTKKQQTEKAALQARLDHINTLVEQTDAIRRTAETTLQPSQERIRQLRDELGSFLWRVDFGEVFATRHDGTPGGFDIAIANPPYVRQERLRAVKPDLKARFDGIDGVYRGTADLYVYFYAQALALLRPNGVLTFISSNKFLRAGYGDGLRKLLRDQTTLELMIDFGDLPVFDATAYPIIVAARKAAPPPDHDVRILTVTDEADIARVAALASEAGTMPQSKLRSEGWQLETPERRALADKLREAGIALGEYVDGKFFYGIKTGFTEAFEIDAATRDRLILEDQRSSELIEPWIRGRDVKKWRAENDNRFVIYIRNSGDVGVNHPWSLSESETDARALFKATYPAIHAHLTKFEAALRKRQDQGRYWWELRPCAYCDVFKQPKILYQRFQVSPVFTLDIDNYLTNDAIWILGVQDYFLLGVLNSRLGWYEISRNCTPIQNGYQLIWDYFKNISIPIPSKEIRGKIGMCQGQ